MRGPILRTVLVDDEPIARQVLEEELAEIPGVIVVGQAESGSQAVEAIDSLKSSNNDGVKGQPVCPDHKPDLH